MRGLAGFRKEANSTHWTYLMVILQVLPLISLDMWSTKQHIAFFFLYPQSYARSFLMYLRLFWNIWSSHITQPNQCCPCLNRSCGTEGVFSLSLHTHPWKILWVQPNSLFREENRLPQLLGVMTADSVSPADPSGTVLAAESCPTKVMSLLRMIHVQWLHNVGMYKLGHLKPPWTNSEGPFKSRTPSANPVVGTALYPPFSRCSILLSSLPFHRC